MQHNTIVPDTWSLGYAKQLSCKKGAVQQLRLQILLQR